jgi:hypothetical protein
VDLQGGQRELEVGPHVLVDVDVGAGGNGHRRDSRLRLESILRNRFGRNLRIKLNKVLM